MKVSKILELDENLKLEIGNEDKDIDTISNIEYQKDNSLVFIGSNKYLKTYLSIESCKEGTLVLASKLWESLNEDELEEVKKRVDCILSSTNFPLSMSKISKPFYDQELGNLNFQVDGRKIGTAKIHPSAVIGENVFIGENVYIGEDVTIMPGVVILPESKIGNRSVLFPNVTICARTEIGEDCRIHGGTTIGSDGFGYNFDSGVHHKVWHFGGVKIGNNVEIGSNVSVDQGTFSPTFIGDGSKIDNQAQVAHNVVLGPGVILCGQVGIAGSAKVGPFCVFGGKSALADGKELGTGVQVAGNTMVMGNWGDGEKLAGHPARPYSEWMKGVAFVRKSSLKK